MQLRNASLGSRLIYRGEKYKTEFRKGDKYKLLFTNQTIVLIEGLFTEVALDD